MAAPPAKTLNALAGSWSMNKKLTDDLQPGLKLQGFGYVMRKLFGNAPIYTQLTQWTTSDGVLHIRVLSTTTANAPAGDTEWILDGEWREKKDPGLGLVKGRAHRIASLDALAGSENAEYLSQGWLTGDGTEHFEFFVESMEHGWTSHTIWGFEEINGERRFTSRVVIAKDKSRVNARIVYDYTGELKA